MEPKKVKKFYRQLDVVTHYALATHQVGLWASEELLIRKHFPENSHLLELGCGAGRIAIGMWEIGYRNLIGIDFAREMVEEARRIAKGLDYPIDFRQGDATGLKFESESFDGAIFGFNGLMQIPKRENRFKAITEAARVIKSGSRFIFTTHDRRSPRNKRFWSKEAKQWQEGTQQEELDEFGDLYRETEWGRMYIHSPLQEEVHGDLKEAGFLLEACMPRSSVANEAQRVRNFADDCRFWVARKE